MLSLKNKKIAYKAKSVLKYLNLQTTQIYTPVANKDIKRLANLL